MPIVPAAIIFDLNIGNSRIRPGASDNFPKANDEKSKRFIEPNFVGKMEYLGKTHLGFSAFDSLIKFHS